MIGCTFFQTACGGVIFQLLIGIASLERVKKEGEEVGGTARQAGKKVKNYHPEMGMGRGGRKGIRAQNDAPCCFFQDVNRFSRARTFSVRSSARSFVSVGSSARL